MWNMNEGGPVAATTGNGTWVDGQLVLDMNGPGPLPNTTWWDLPIARRKVGGGFVVSALIRGASGSLRGVLAEVGGTAPLLGSGNPIPGTPYTIGSIAGFALSSNGAHHATIVRDTAGSGNTWLLVDGVPASIYGEYFARRQPVAPEVIALAEDPLSLEGVTYPEVLDDGSWSAVAMLYTPSGQLRWQTVRNGRLLGGLDHVTPAGSATRSAPACPTPPASALGSIWWDRTSRTRTTCASSRQGFRGTRSGTAW